MTGIERYVERMEADMRRIESLRSRWRALFAGSIAMNGAALYAIFARLPITAAVTLLVGSMVLIYSAQHCLSRAKQILRKYEDMTMP